MQPYAASNVCKKWLPTGNKKHQSATVMYIQVAVSVGRLSRLKSESRLSVTVDDPTLVVAESGLLTKKAYEYIILQKSSLPQTNKQNHTEQYGDLHCSNYKQENDS